MWSAWLKFLLIGRDHSAGERKEYLPRKLRSDEEALRWRGRPDLYMMTLNLT